MSCFPIVFMYIPKHNSSKWLWINSPQWSTHRDKNALVAKGQQNITILAGWNKIFISRLKYNLLFGICKLFFTWLSNYTVTGFYFRSWHHSSEDVLALFFYNQNCNGELKDSFLLTPYKNFLSSFWSPQIFCVPENIVLVWDLGMVNMRNESWMLYLISVGAEYAPLTPEGSSSLWTIYFKVLGIKKSKCIWRWFLNVPASETFWNLKKYIIPGRKQRTSEYSLKQNKA